MSVFSKMIDHFSNQKHRNLNFEEKARLIGASWNEIERKWIAHELAKEEFDKLCYYYFSDMKIIEVTGKFEDAREGYKEYRHIAGYIVATATGRDSGAKKSKDIVILSGGFSSAGSAKNYYCSQKENTKIRMRISEAVLKEIEENESLRERYNIFVATEVGEAIDLESMQIRNTDEEILRALEIIANAGKDRVKELAKNFK